MNEEELRRREEQLEARLARIAELETAVRQREKAAKDCANRKTGSAKGAAACSS